MHQRHLIITMSSDIIVDEYIVLHLFHSEVLSLTLCWSELVEMLANQLLCDRFLFKDSLWSLSDIPCFTLPIVSWQYSHVQFAIVLKRNKRWQKPGRVFVSVREFFFYYEVETSWIKEKRKCLTATLIIYIDFTLYVSFLLLSFFICLCTRTTK